VNSSPLRTIAVSNVQISKAQVGNAQVATLPISVTDAVPEVFSDLTIIIPTWNEAANIGLLLDQLDQLYPGAHIIVVDDRSTDGTQEKVRRSAAANQNTRTVLLERTEHMVKGLTASVLDAVEASQTQYFVVIDGDFQHPPQKIGAVYAELCAGYLLVIGTRVSIDEQWPWQRKLASSYATRLAQGVLRLRGMRATDPLSGFFGGSVVLTKVLIERYRRCFEDQGYKVLFDLLKLFPTALGNDKDLIQQFGGVVKAQDSLALIESIIKEVPYSFAKRNDGSSKFGIRHAWCFIRSFLR